VALPSSQIKIGQGAHEFGLENQANKQTAKQKYDV